MSVNIFMFDTKFYTCRAYNISITKHPDGTEEVKQQQTNKFVAKST
jgi:hypothetical protein